MILGGHLKEIPKPHRRKFEDKRRKRKVKVTISVFWGAGKHYYVDIDEEHNSLWNSSENTWQNAWDDGEGNGEVFSKKFLNRGPAERYIAKIFKKHFPKKTHKLVLDLLGETTQWFYKEGGG